MGKRTIGPVLVSSIVTLFLGVLAPQSLAAQNGDPCITVSKQVSVIPDNFHDADTIGDPLFVGAPTGALYQIQVENCGDSACQTIELDDRFQIVITMRLYLNRSIVSLS